MTLQRATEYAFIGMWLYLVVSLLQTGLIIWEPNFFYANPTILKFVLVLGNILSAVPLIIFFNALRRGQSRQ